MDCDRVAYRRFLLFLLRYPRGEHLYVVRFLNIFCLNFIANISQSTGYGPCTALDVPTLTYEYDLYLLYPLDQNRLLCKVSQLSHKSESLANVL